MPTNDTVLGTFQGRGDNDFIQLKNKEGQVLGGWDAEAVGYGALAAGGAIQTLKVAVNTAALLALPTPFEIIPAPAAGEAIVILSAAIQYIAGATPFTIADADNLFQLTYEGGVGLLANWTATGIVDSATDKFLQTFVPANGEDALDPPEALNVELNLTGTSPELTLGNGSVNIFVSYYLITL